MKSGVCVVDDLSGLKNSQDKETETHCERMTAGTLRVIRRPPLVATKPCHASHPTGTQGPGTRSPFSPFKASHLAVWWSGTGLNEPKRE